MSLWWLQPGWTDARCSCGANIAASGGDPDWGYCWPCMQRRTERQSEEREAERRYYREMEEAYYAQLAGDEEYDSWSAA